MKPKDWLLTVIITGAFVLLAATLAPNRLKVVVGVVVGLAAFALVLLAFRESLITAGQNGLQNPLPPTRDDSPMAVPVGVRGAFLLRYSTQSSPFSCRKWSMNSRRPRAATSPVASSSARSSAQS